MADAIDLDPGGYRGTYKMIGGTPALDFANLVSYRGTDRQHDWLDPATNVSRWSLEAGILAASGADIDALRDLRELLARIFLAIADGGAPTFRDIDRIGTLAAQASARRRLRYPDGADAAAWVDANLSVHDQLALDAAAVLTSADAVRTVAACQECRWLYLDATRNHSRRWCDPADCGNRARQRRHYHRHRSARQASEAAQ